MVEDVRVEVGLNMEWGRWVVVLADGMAAIYLQLQLQAVEKGAAQARLPSDLPLYHIWASSCHSRTSHSDVIVKHGMIARDRHENIHTLDNKLSIIIPFENKLKSHSCKVSRHFVLVVRQNNFTVHVDRLHHLPFDPHLLLGISR